MVATHDNGGHSGEGVGDTYLTPEDIAKLLKVKRKHILDLLRAGKLKGVKIGKLWRVKEADLKVFLGESPNPPKGITP